MGFISGVHVRPRSGGLRGSGFVGREAGARNLALRMGLSFSGRGPFKSAVPALGQTKAGGCPGRGGVTWALPGGAGLLLPRRWYSSRGRGQAGGRLEMRSAALRGFGSDGG